MAAAAALRGTFEAAQQGDPALLQTLPVASLRTIVTGIHQSGVLRSKAPGTEALYQKLAPLHETSLFLQYAALVREAASVDPSSPIPQGTRFELSEPLLQLRLVVVEMNAIMQQISKQRKDKKNELCSSDLFASSVHQTHIKIALGLLLSEVNVFAPEAVLDALLHLEHGLDMILHLILNGSLTILQAWDTLISFTTLATTTTQSDWWIARCIGCIRLLADLAPRLALVLRAKLMSLEVHPGLVLDLTFSYCGDEAMFFNSLLYDSAPYKWMLTFIRNNPQNDMVQRLRARLFEGLMAHRLLAQNERNSLIRMASALLSGATQRFTQAEAAACIKALHYPVQEDASGARFLHLGLCFLLSSATLFAESDSRHYVDFLKGMMQRGLAARSAGSDAPFASCLDLLLLTAIHLHLGNLPNVANLVRSTLGVSIQVPKDSLTYAKTVFGTHVFTEEILVTHAVSISPTPHLGASHQGFLPIHCVYFLLRSRLFVKHNVSAKAFILAQLRELSTSDGVHPLVAPLVEAYADLAVEPLGTEASGNAHPPRLDEQDKFRGAQPMERPDDAEIIQLLATDNLTQAVLVSYFVLCYQSTRLQRIARGAPSFPMDPPPPVPAPYTPEVLDALPVRAVLDVLARSPDRFSGVGPQLSALVSVFFPEVFVVETLLDGEADQGDDTQWLRAYCAIPNGIAITPVGPHAALWLAPDDGAPTPAMRGVLQAALDNPAPCTLLLAYLLELPDAALLRCCDVLLADFLPHMLQPGRVDHMHATLFLRLWRRLNQSSARRLWPATLHHLRRERVQERYRLAHSDYINDPLLVLQCHPAVFASEPLTRMLLAMLEGYLIASEAQIEIMRQKSLPAAGAQQDGGMVGPGTTAPSALGGGGAGGSTGVLGTTSAGAAGLPGGVVGGGGGNGMGVNGMGGGIGVSSNAELDELASALTNAQQSAIVQMLMEACADPLPFDGARKGDRDRIQAIRGVICAFIHQMYINHPLLARIVHLQGYAPELIHVMVVGVPSMHICLDFIPDLLASKDIKQQIFGVQLAGELAERYPIPKALNVGRDVLGRMHIMATETEERRIAFFCPTLPSLVKLCKAFPLLTEPAFDLLVKLQKIQNSHHAVHFVRDPMEISRGFGGNLERTFQQLVEEVIVRLNV